MKVTQSCLTLLYSHGILQVRTLEWVAFPFSRGSSQPRDLNPGLPHCMWFLYQLSQKGNPRTLEWVAYLFSSESALCIRWPKYWNFSISPSNEYSGLISFRIDWFDLLAMEGILKSLLQHHSSKASNLWCSAFFMVQPSHP